MNTIAAVDLKFAVCGAIDDTMRTRVLYLEPGTIGFNNFYSIRIPGGDAGQVHESKDKGRSRRGV